MAVQWDVKTNSTQEWRVLPADITIKPSLNGRHVLPDIEPLIQDILLNGQHTPVVIRKENGKPVLCAGFSRYRAVSEINKRELAPIPLQLRCTYTQCTEAEGFLLAISENRQRQATTPMDDAHNIALLMRKFAMTEEQVAAQYFPGAEGQSLKDALRFVRQRLALIDLSPEAEKALLEGRLKGSAAVKIAKLSKEQQTKAVAAAGEGRVTAPKASGKPPLKTTLKAAWETGKIEYQGKQIVLPDVVVDWLATLLESKKTPKAGQSR
jgi:ParB/RepB/Spo0J family partition protein